MKKIMTIDRKDDQMNRHWLVLVIFVALALGGSGLLPIAAMFGPKPAYADSIVLDPMNPLANFIVETAQSPPLASATPGPALVVGDPSPADLIRLYAPTPLAAPDSSIDLFVTFKILPGETRAGADTGVRFIINDGLKAVYYCAIVKAGLKGMAIAAGTNFTSEANYPDVVFTVVDWTTPNPPTPDGRVSFHLRKTPLYAEVLEVNGVAPVQPFQVLYAALPPPTRALPSIEFGAMNLEAAATMEIIEFRAISTPQPVPEPVSLLLLGSGLAGLAVFRKRFKA